MVNDLGINVASANYRFAPKHPFLAAHDDGEVQPITQWLFVPMIDDRTAADTSLAAANHLVWNDRANRTGWDGYSPRWRKRTGCHRMRQPPAALTSPDSSGLSRGR